MLPINLPTSEDDIFVCFLVRYILKCRARAMVLSFLDECILAGVRPKYVATVDSISDMCTIGSVLARCSASTVWAIDRLIFSFCSAEKAINFSKAPSSSRTLVRRFSATYLITFSGICFCAGLLAARPKLAPIIVSAYCLQIWQRVWKSGLSILTTIPEIKRLTSFSDSCPIIFGCASETKTTCLPARLIVLKVWRNSSCVEGLLARKWISSIASKSVCRILCRNCSSFFIFKASMN